MKNNILVKIFTSMPIILIVLYFIPCLGICFILLRYSTVNKKKRTSTQMLLIGVGLLILLLKDLNTIFDMMKLDARIIPYFQDMIHSKLYSVDLINYGQFLLTLGIIFLIISFAFDTIFNKLGSFIFSYINQQDKRDAEIFQKNDLMMKEKQEKAKNTHVVNCPYCGADNLLTAKVGICKYCRRNI